MPKSSLYLVAIIAPAFAQQISPTINQFPSREFGHPTLPPPNASVYTTSPNLVEGREVWSPFGVAVDTSVSPPILYIADSLNNRVLGYKNANSIAPCGPNNPACGFADLVIGQRDLFTTLGGGPGRPGLAYGFFTPMALRVDASGNLYVVDQGNNRILRFPSPFKQSGSNPNLIPDLVIGQKTFNSGVSTNEGSQVPSAKSLNFQTNVAVTSIAFDSAGNLWVPDSGNNRVLRFPAAQLVAGTIEPQADIVLGQLDFQTATELPTPNGFYPDARFFKQSVRQPSAIAVAPNGDIYVADSYGRVLYYLNGMPSGSAGVSASRILGLGSTLTNQPQLIAPNSYQLLSTTMGLAMSGSNLFVADPGENRIVKYDTPDKWPAEPLLISGQPVNSQFSPPMIDVTGQNTLTSGSKINKGQAEPDASTLNGPLALAFSGSDLWVADTNNNRVSGFVQASGRYPNATRLAGQLDWPYTTPNLIEGREVSFCGNCQAAFAGVAIDKNSSPPHLYIADTNNNRILAFKDARNAGSTADMVIGQRDFYRSLINGGTNDPQLPNQSGLYLPRGLVVDASGNLYVADSGNGRVLRFPAPFSQPAGAQQLPNLVLGQSSFNSQVFDASIVTMAAPVGLAFFSDGSLAVSDVQLNRVLIFKLQGSDFQNGQAASIVLGQPDPNSSNPAANTSAGPASAAGMFNPRQIAVDTSDRLYVADFGNSRLMVWTNARNQTTGATSSSQFNGLAGTQGVVVSPISGEIWITNSQNNQIIELPEYNNLILGATPNNYKIDGFIQAQTAAAAVALDASDNPIVAESANRVTFFFPALVFKNAASFNTQPIAPGMITLLGRAGKAFSITTDTAQALPWPTKLGDTQVLVNGIAAPMYYASDVINIQVPTKNMPTSGNVNFEVKRVSTGETLATGVFAMAPYSPGFFTRSGTGQGQVAAFNVPNAGETFTDFVNTPSNAVSRDGNHYIAFCLTGGGIFDGGPDPAPGDGQAPAGAAATHVQPTVVLNPPGQIVASSDVSSAAGCGYPGLWQVNVKVPFATPPLASVQVVITLGDTRSNVGPSGGSIVTTFATK